MSIKQQLQLQLCSYPKMTSQNDWQDESLTGQVRDQAGHCPLTGCYFQPVKIENNPIFIETIGLVKEFPL